MTSSSRPHFEYASVVSSARTSELKYYPPWSRQARFTAAGQVEYYQSSEQYRLGNHELPVALFRELIVSTVESNLVTIIAAPTGTGKSTSVPQMLFESGQYDRIIMTQPRIVAARKVSERIGEEMTEALGIDSSNIVGYRTANEGNAQPENRITVCTDGLVLMQMLEAGTIGKNDVIMIDEFHERNTNMDIVLALCLKQNIRVVIASATIDTVKLAQYCSTTHNKSNVPIIEVPGKMFNVEEKEGGSFTDEIVNAAQQGKNVLAFIPGAKEAESSMSRLTGRLPRGYTVLLLNGDQTPDEQQKCFSHYPGGKVIISTSVGQTSLTIDDIDVVIDSGWERTGEFKKGVGSVPIQPCSKATSEQRRGRVGRIRKGEYVLAKLEDYPPLPRDEQGILMREAYDNPEITKQNLTSITLRLALGRLALSDLDLFDSPKEIEIVESYRRLVKFGAATLGLSALTEIGHNMAHVPIDANYARMLVASRDYSDRVQLQMMAAVAVRQMRGIGSNSKDQNWLSLSRENRSEILTQLDILIAIIHMDETERSSYGIIEQRFAKVLKTFERLADDAGLDMDELATPTEAERKELIACIISGSNELFVRVGGNNYRDSREKIRVVSSSSNLDGTYGLMVGSAFDIYNMSKSGPRRVRIINDGTGVTIGDLEKYAPHRCSYEPQGMLMGVDGKVVHNSLVFFDGVSTRRFSKQPAAPSPETQEIIIEALVRGYDAYYPKSSHVDDLHRCLTELHSLQHKTAENLTLDNLIRTVIRERVPVNVTSIEDAALYITSNQIENLISPEKRDSILSAAPEQIEIASDDGLVIANVTYHNNVATLVLPSKYIIDIPDRVEALGEREIVIGISGSAYMPLQKAKEKHNRDSRSARRGSRRDNTSSTGPVSTAPGVAAATSPPAAPRSSAKTKFSQQRRPKK
jgi:HrpA-like RNA helicase